MGLDAGVVADSREQVAYDGVISPQFHSCGVAVHVTTGVTPQAGGPYVSVAGLVNALAQDGRWTPLVVAPVSLPAASIDREHWGRTTMLTLPQREAAGAAQQSCDGRWHERVSQVVRRNPCVVHLHGLWDAGTFVVAELVRRRQCGFVVSPRGMLEPWALGHKRWKKKLFLLGYLRRLLSTADLWHATSDGEADSLRTLGFRQPIAVIPNGIDASRAVAPAGGPA